MRNSKLNAAIDETRRSGAAWDESVFKEFMETTVPFLESQLGKKDKRNVLPVFVKLGAEAIGEGVLKNIYDPKWKDSYMNWMAWTSLLEVLWTMIIPTGLAAIPEKERADRLLDFWNLADNIASQTTWMEPFLINQIKEKSPELAELENFFIEELRPMLEAPETTWSTTGNKNAQLEVVDCSLFHSDFLPGDMYFSAPSVICVRDRRNEGLFGGIYLTQEKCTLVGHFRDFGYADKYGEASPKPELELAPGKATIRPGGEAAATKSELPFLAEPFSTASGEGAVAISALDSQRVWVLRP